MGLAEAINNQMKWDLTENGEQCLNTSGSACLDMFGRSGSMRNAEVVAKHMLIDSAYAENADMATKLLFYTRDIRGGYGERDTFQQMIRHLAIYHTDTVIKNIWAIIEFGRAKDLYCLVGTPAEDAMWEFMKKQFELDYENMKKGNSISLLAKWIATPDSASENTRIIGKETAKRLGYSYKELSEYKKKLHAMRKYLNLIEIKMSQGRWDEIEYSMIGSKAMLRYKRAFERHDEKRFSEFIANVINGSETMNMSVATPCDILSKVMCNRSNTAAYDAMWKSLPDVNNSNVMVMCDTSGSMLGGCCSMKPITVAISLALYFAERNKGDLKDFFMTFSEYPSLIKIQGESLVEKIYNIEDASWGLNTNIESAFKLLLDTCIKGKVQANEMPKALLIVSDMQIDRCSDNNNEVQDNKLTFYDKMKDMYSRNGYDMPHLIFWNVNAKNATFHASLSDNGVSLVSGYSVNVFNQLIDNIGKTPYELMMSVVNNERYKDIIA